MEQFNIPVYYPANFEKVVVKGESNTMIQISPKLLTSSKDNLNLGALTKEDKISFKGCCIVTPMEEEMKILDCDETLMEINALIKMVKGDNGFDYFPMPHRNLQEGYCFKISENYLKNFRGKTFKENLTTAKSDDLLVLDIKSKVNSRVIQPDILHKIKEPIQYEVQDDFLLISTADSKMDNEDTIMIHLDAIQHLLSEFH